MTISIVELEALMTRIVAAKHYSSDEAQKIVEVLLYGELAGKGTQGVLKLLGGEPAQDIKPDHKPTITKRSEISLLVDGSGSAGPLPAQMAAAAAIETAARHGFAIAGMRNTYSSVGAIGFYARKIAQHDCIGIVAASSPRAVVQFGGIDPLYGTNPIAFGFPTADHPVVFDAAASAITWYGLVRAKVLGIEIPPGVAIDRSGNPTTDPSAAMEGALLPFDRSYKGSGFALVVEMLAGVLTGASYAFDEGDWGTTFIAVSPNLLLDTAEFKKRSSDLVAKIKASRTEPGTVIRVPGYDLEGDIEAALARGTIEMDDVIVEQLRALDPART